MQVTKAGGFEAEEAPSGDLLYYVKDGSHAGLWTVPVRGGNETFFLDSVWQSYWTVADDGTFL